MRPDQNPDIVQEEKPETAKEAVKKEIEVKKTTKRKKKQLTKKEREWITGMLKDEQTPVKAAKKNKSKEVIPQIDDVEKQEIAGLLTEKKSSEKADIPEKPTESVKRQINDKEKEQIVMLLGGGFAKDNLASEKRLKDVIDYESLNKQEMVELLEEVVQEKDISRIRSKVAKIKTAFYHRNKEDLEKALNEAKNQYAEKINKSKSIKAILISGVAGNDSDGYIVRNQMLIDSSWKTILFEESKIKNILLSKEQVKFIFNETKKEIIKKNQQQNLSNKQRIHSTSKDFTLNSRPRISSCPYFPQNGHLEYRSLTGYSFLV